ncbi:MAG TPA: DsbA family protein [Vicinamibacterales bacterium]|nr:DsbA family protein [Vicinamibacterales bacterium]
MCRLRAGGFVFALILSGSGSYALKAQGAESGIAVRLASLEGAVHSLERQVAELAALLRSALPPSRGGAISEVDLKIDSAPVKGSRTAKVVLIEYSDFECPFCGRHAQTTYHEIQKHFVETGKVQYIFRHLPLEKLHPNARRASEVAECARVQGKFWEVHDRLFANQRALAISDLRSYAQAEKLELPRFESCLSKGESTERINADMAEAGRLGLTGTPAFLIGQLQTDGTVRVNQKIVGAQPFDVFKAALDALIK